ncbi:MAG: hypothetical protein AB7S75_25645 [Desulfococcaceae bacterium]
MKKRIITSLMTLCFVLIIFNPVFGEEILLQLIKKTDYSLQDSKFYESSSGQYPGYALIYGGDVYYMGEKIGDFTANFTKTTYTGDNGRIINYDIIVPSGGSLAEFISVRANIISAKGPGHGTIYAASPAFKSLMGNNVEISEDIMRILY